MSSIGAAGTNSPGNATTTEIVETMKGIAHTQNFWLSCLRIFVFKYFCTYREVGQSLISISVLSRDNYGRGGRDYGRDHDRRRAYSPLRGGRDVSPPMKRSRYDSDQGLSQPAMMTFKQFLSSQDDCIDDQDAVKKYADYKTDFKRQQLEEFFKNHKDEEWSVYTLWR